ncbi:MAG: RsmD family RNA methyltransferase, partial [Clostridiales bacterium]|nr:RsmD family RNA methyltransferase [Clostridiales bacterium]
MRIITGTARGTKLAAPEGENTRPTADMTKEAVFS